MPPNLTLEQQGQRQLIPLDHPTQRAVPPQSSWGYLGRYKPIPHPAHAGVCPQRWAEIFGGGQAGTCCQSQAMLSPEGTWRSQLRLAGGPGQGQALPEPVHPVEPQGQLRFRHGFQGFGRGEGEFGLIGQAGLGALGVPGAPRLEGERGEVRGELRWVPQPQSAPLDAAVCRSHVFSGARCQDGEAQVRLSRVQGCSVLVPRLSQHTDVVQTRCQLEASSISCSKHVQPFTVPLSPAIVRSRFLLQACSTLFQSLPVLFQAHLSSPTSNLLEIKPALAS